ncbi:MAG: hypothetical protein KDB80_08005, partial [Planctomycetes bacterium]|nr:hypothetical protein [Planctomycetota bacterium]
MSRLTLTRILALATIAGTAHAQISFPVSISDSCNGNTVTYSLTSLPTAPDDPITSSANVNFGATGSCDGDIAYAHHPMFLIPGQSRYLAFFDSGVPADQGYVSSFAYGNEFVIDWLDVNNATFCSARWCAQIHCCGSNGAIVDHTWRFTFIGVPYGAPPGGGSTFDLGFVAYTDFDVLAAGANQSSGAASGDRHLIENPSCPNEAAEFWGEMPDNWEVGAWPSVIDTLQTDPFPGLLNGTIPFGPDDYSGAMEWIRTFDPAYDCYYYGGGYYCTANEIVIRYSQSINCLQCANTATVTSYGTGDVTLSTTALGSLGSPIDLHVASGGQNPGVFWFGLPAAPLPFSFVFPTCSTFLYVSSPLSTIPVTADMSGVVDFEFPGL